MDAIIKNTFWTDPRVESLSAEEKLACLWLMTNPSRDICGFTISSNNRFEFESKALASSLQGASKGLGTSIEEVSDGVWFAVNFLRHQFGKGGRLSLGNKVVIAAARHAAKLPEPMRDAFFKAYPELVELVQNSTSHSFEKEAPSNPHTGKRDGVRVGEGAGEGETCGSISEQAFELCSLHPSRNLSKPALTEAMKAIQRHGFEKVHQGVLGYAAAVAAWTPAERTKFVKNAAEFFADDLWNQPQENYGGRRTNGARTNGHHRVDTGGRKPSLSLMNELYPEPQP